MKNLKELIVLAVVLIIAIFASVTLAGTPKADTATISAGGWSWTNTEEYAAVKLISLEAFGMQPADSTQTVKRIRDGRTNTVGSIVGATGAGIYRETNTVYLFKGDVLVGSGAGTNAGTVEVVGEELP